MNGKSRVYCSLHFPRREQNTAYMLVCGLDGESRCTAASRSVTQQPEQRRRVWHPSRDLLARRDGHEPQGEGESMRHTRQGHERPLCLHLGLQQLVHQRQTRLGTGTLLLAARANMA